MAIRNNTGAVAGMSWATTLSAVDDFTFTCLAKYRQAHSSGEQPFFQLATATQNLELRARSLSGSTWAFVLDKSSGTRWDTLEETEAATGYWVAIGISCSGVGTGLLTISHSTGESEPVTAVTTTLGGSSWTPTILRLLHGTLGWGSYMDVQNVKYGANALTSAQMNAECWSTAVEYPAVWTPALDVDMTSGVLATQAGAMTLVNDTGNIIIAEGYLAVTGTAPTITISSCVETYDDLAVVGTITTTGGATVNVFLLQSGATVGSIAATLDGLSWTADFNGVAPGTYVVRAQVTDGGGTVTADDAAIFVGFSGTDEIPYTYPNTLIKAVPASASIPAGSTATFKAVNQDGTAIPGAVVTSAASTGTAIASTPDLTDADGNLVVTASTAGTADLVLSIMNLSGATLKATVPITVTAASTSTVTLTPSTVGMFAGQTQQFTSTISGGGTTTWTLQSGLGSIDSDGLYTAPAVATTAIVRAAKTGELTSYDETTITVSAGDQSNIGGNFLDTSDITVAPGSSITWSIRITVDGAAFEGGTIAAAASTAGVLTLDTDDITNANGIAVITAEVASDTPEDIEVDVTFTLTAGDLTMELVATVTVEAAPFGYVRLRGRLYPRPYEKK